MSLVLQSVLHPDVDPATLDPSFYQFVGQVPGHLPELVRRGAMARVEDQNPGLQIGDPADTGQRRRRDFPKQPVSVQYALALREDGLQRRMPVQRPGNVAAG